MDGRLISAAQTGDIDTLYTLLTQDPLLLDKTDQFPFHQTPLHVSASAGQTSFCMELSNLKPAFITKLNHDGYTPIHIASTEGYAEIVRELLEIDNELSIMKGREWRTPLHCAAITGKVGVLDELLSVRPECVRCLTVRKETALHLALKNDQIEAFRVLVEGLKGIKAEEVVNRKDREGNTVLHLAACKKQLEVVELLLNTDHVRELVEINTKNKIGLTPLDVLEPNDTEIKNILRGAGAVTGHDVIRIASYPPSLTNHANNRIEPLIIMEKLFQGFPMGDWEKEIEDSPSETRNALLVVAVLIATVTFQAVLSPPGGYSNLDYGITIFSISTSMGYDCPAFLVIFSCINAIGFVTSLAMITVLTRRFPLKALLRIAVLSMAATYLCSIVYTVINGPVLVTIVALSMLAVLFVQWLYLKMRSLRRENYV